MPRLRFPVAFWYSMYKIRKEERPRKALVKAIVLGDSHVGKTSFVQRSTRSALHWFAGSDFCMSLAWAGSPIAGSVPTV